MSRELKINPSTAHKAVMHVVSKGRLREIDRKAVNEIPRRTEARIQAMVDSAGSDEAETQRDLRDCDSRAER
jgi:hypothetical protein